VRRLAVIQDAPRERDLARGPFVPRETAVAREIIAPRLEFARGRPISDLRSGRDFGRDAIAETPARRDRIEAASPARIELAENARREIVPALDEHPCGREWAGRALVVAIDQTPLVGVCGAGKDFQRQRAEAGLIAEQEVGERAPGIQIVWRRAYSQYPAPARKRQPSSRMLFGTSDSQAARATVVFV